MDRNEELRQWFKCSKQDLDVAKHLINNMRPTPDEAICFHCQQSVEKDLKGFLFFNGTEFEKTHDLLVLLDICVDIIPEFTKFGKQCTFLSRFAVMPRYPNEVLISDDDAKSAIRFAEDIKQFVMSKVNLSEN